MQKKLLDYRLKGFCCGQIIADLYLKEVGKENQDLVDAMAGLCYGAWQEKTCGALTAALCILYLDNPQEASDKNVRDILDWFESVYETTECEILLEGNPINKVERCPFIIESVWNEVVEMIE